MKTKIAVAALSCLIALSSWSASINDLLPNERNTVELFKKFSPKVVYVHRMSTVLKRPFSRVQVPSGAGSGIIWDDKGHIVTNFHVINGAEALSVSIGEVTFPARVVGVEPRKDIAVLAVSSPRALAMLKSFKPFELIHSTDLMVGQQALAIGNPFGLDHSLTVGVISALGRQVPGAGGVTIREMIQTDASINPGNSGGPLLDSKGRLIGMNTAIFSNTGSSAGIGFAVPADDLEHIVPQLINKGRVVLSGIGVQRVEPRLAARFGVTKGIMVADVIPNSPAAKAGLQGTWRDSYGRLHLGDVITAINGKPTNNYDVFYHLLAKVKVGEKIEATVLRQGKTFHIPMRTIDISAVG
ncbi:S1C family serine protease [Legionella sp. CNM-4043-24]|uniref:S1C family serine protease n=1 Tax=Legionella sp. CNM-4043-24 TaxID=3421646 RepID=UPI00403AC6E5